MSLLEGNGDRGPCRRIACGTIAPAGPLDNMAWADRPAIPYDTGAPQCRAAGQRDALACASRWIAL